MNSPSSKDKGENRMSISTDDKNDSIWPAIVTVALIAVTIYLLMTLLVMTQVVLEKMVHCEWVSGEWKADNAKRTNRRWEANPLTIGLTGTCVDPGDKGL